MVSSPFPGPRLNCPSHSEQEQTRWTLFVILAKGVFAPRAQTRGVCLRFHSKNRKSPTTPVPVVEVRRVSSLAKKKKNVTAGTAATHSLYFQEPKAIAILFQGRALHFVI